MKLKTFTLAEIEKYLPFPKDGAEIIINISIKYPSTYDYLFYKNLNHYYSLSFTQEEDGKYLCNTLATSVPQSKEKLNFPFFDSVEPIFKDYELL